MHRLPASQNPARIGTQRILFVLVFLSACIMFGWTAVMAGLALVFSPLTGLTRRGLDLTGIPLFPITLGAALFGLGVYIVLCLVFRDMWSRLKALTPR